MPQPTDSVQPPFNSQNRDNRAGGKVFLVGAGPGDPGLITVRARECLMEADVVLFDGLANAELLDLAPQAECLSVGKHGKIPIWTQAAINDKLVELALKGKRVVRLKGGDPAVFARTAEELEALVAAHIPFEVVPGITAALAAASYVGIPITHRQHASAVAFVTGQQQRGQEPQPIDWGSLAKFPGTIVFYMGVTTARQWTSKLISAGKPPDTPAAIVRRCTWSDQQVVRCHLSDVADRLTPASKMRPPVIVIIGQVACLGQDFDWFSARPLHGCGILVTRPSHQSAELTQELCQLGADVYHQPTMQVTAPSNTSSLDRAISALVEGTIQGVTFSSTNGVDGLLSRLRERGYDSRVFARARIAAVGPATARQLSEFGLRADVLPAEGADYSARGLLQQLAGTVTNQNWIVTTTNRSSGQLRRGLEECGAIVSEALAYETQDVAELRPGIAAALEAGRIHLVTVTSAAIAEATDRLLADHIPALTALSLSSKISEHLRTDHWSGSILAATHTNASLVEAAIHAWNSRSR